jgi:hypothetical protein
MDLIDNGDLNIKNISYKIEMIKALIEKLKKDPGNNQKEIMKIQIRLD